jgi:Ser/Thr protein kinase RdoA (MazF antagonist)
MRTERGDFLLKRRARGKDDAFRVAFAHSLQLYLARKQFPLPHLIGTRKENNSMLQWRGGIYELFEFIQGGGYDNSPEAAQEAGKVLALFHKLVREYEPPTGSYHASRAVGGAFEQLPMMLARVDPQNAARESTRIDEVGAFLRTSYREAALRVNDCGLPDWPMQITHCDWHPGNMLFRKTRVVAVIDYDAARLQQRITDVANGALQFSILGGGDDASQWPDYVDEGRYKRFLTGYDSINVLSKAELRTLPWLMIEALIAESVIPIAATGSFARMEGLGFMLMIERKVRWLQKHVDKLAQVLET